MWSLWKEVLLPGRQRDAKGNWFSFDGSDIKAAHGNARAMLSRGLPVPCVWEHQNVEVADPEEWKARYAKHTFAHIGGARINDRGALELRLDGRDPKDRDQVLKTKFVSPKVYRRYSDSTGGEYRGATIAHVAATPTPVQFWQRPFELGQSDALYLSFQPEGTTMPDDDKGDKSDKGKDKPKGEGKEGGGDESISALIEALKSQGMNIPDEVVDISGLIIAVKANPPAQPATPLEEPGDEDGGKPPTGATPAGSPPMLMSSTDPKVQAWAKNDRKDLQRRVRALFKNGKVDKPTAEKLMRQVDSHDLSYTTAGDMVESPVVVKIKAYEELPGQKITGNGYRPAGQALSTLPVGAPDELTGGNEDKEKKDAIDFLCKNLPAAKK